MTKTQIRNKILLRLKKQKEEDSRKKSRLIKNKLFKASVFKKAKIVMFYVSFGGEVQTQEMIKDAQELGKIVVVPVCKKNRVIKPCRFHAGANFTKGPYGVCEPASKKFINLEDLDLVITPGVAFDKKGNRLGRGKGYYDCFLKKLSHKTATVGLAFDFQVLPDIPATRQDVQVNRVIFA